MTNILLRIFDLEIKNKHIIKEKDRHVQNLHGDLERDSLHATLKETNANYWGLKTEKDILNIKHSKLQRDYKHMEETFFK
jgi:hypothetical protein